MTTKIPRPSSLTTAVTTKRINFANATISDIEMWLQWFDTADEQAFSDPRQRSYFRVNKANLKAEIDWRKKEIPF